MTELDQNQAVIEVETSYFFMSFLLGFFKPKVSINATQPFDVGWGRFPIPVPPGRYQVEVWLPYFFLPTLGRNGTVIDVPAGGVVQVAWRAPWIVFMRGRISVAGPWPVGSRPGSAVGPLAGPSMAPHPAGTPADWYPDPSGRHEHRYHDGSEWTEHVADFGVSATDPVDG